MSKIDILLMSDNSLDTIGGSEESTKIILKGLKDIYKLGVVQPGKIVDPELSVNYYPISKDKRLKIIFKNPFKFLNYLIKVVKIIKKQNPKIIHTQAQVNFFIVGLLFKLRLIPKSIKFIHTERGLYTKYSLLIRKVFLFFMRELDVLVTTTNFNKKLWEKALLKRKYSIKLIIIENTAGELFETYEKGKVIIDDEKLVIGFAGRYVNWKNWPLAVEIVEELNKVLGDKLIVKMAVGCLDDKAKKETNKMFSNLEQLLGNRFTGMINLDIEAMSKFYYDLDIYILTSDYNTESFGRTLVEAMSRKTIVLTTDSGGSVEVVGNRDNVLINVEEFVERVMYFYNNRDLMRKEKENNYNRVRIKYSFNNNISKHIDLYTKILNTERDINEHITS